MRKSHENGNTAAEGAAHLNGEAAELEATVAGLEGRRW